MLSKRSWWKLRSMGGIRLSEAVSEDLCQHLMFRSYSQTPHHPKLTFPCSLTC